MPSRFVCLSLASLALLLAGAGCHRAPSAPALDEAAQVARARGIPLDQYARENFYPREVQNYFAGMAQIAAPAATGEGKLAAYQLLDRHPLAAPALVDPLPAKFNPPAETLDREAAVKLHRNEVLGRNSWMIWCGGNEAFWDWLATDTFGFIDSDNINNTNTMNAIFGIPARVVRSFELPQERLTAATQRPC